ncbi:MAG: hypothetical protein H0X63_04410, partial [Flavobacteriales bacterium]|nr:hypothetical protein [Flavobacteriales bacterium]
IRLQLPRSGFDSAIRSILEWEKYIQYVAFWIKGIENLSNYQQNIIQINHLMNNGYDVKQESNLKKWLTNNPRIISITDKTNFTSLFQPIENDNIKQ